MPRHLQVSRDVANASTGNRDTRSRSTYYIFCIRFLLRPFFLHDMRVHDIAIAATEIIGVDAL